MRVERPSAPLFPLRGRGPARSPRGGVVAAHSPYLVVILIPVLVGMMLFIHRQYRAAAAQLVIPPDVVIARRHQKERVVIPVAGIDRAVVQAINLGRAIDPSIRAVVISDNPEAALALRAEWETRFEDVPLDIVEAPYRALAGPMLAYLDELDQGWPAGEAAPITFVIVPEFVPRHWWERPLYNQSTKALRAALLGRPHTVAVDMPYRRGEPNGGVSNPASTPA